MAAKKLVVGIIAHVDSGKTTLAEDILYETGCIKEIGRVDHKNSYMDNYSLEKERGITIFSKQAVLTYGELQITLLDTPGHIDFCAEMERTLQVLDYAIFVVSATDGIQGHTKTIWELLKRYSIPTFIFVNKMDQPEADRNEILKEMQQVLHGNCIDFTEVDTVQFYENVLLCSEELLEKYDENCKIADEDIQRAILRRELFPCIFGSALKQEGVKELLDAIKKYSINKQYKEAFSARIYKIGRDENNVRLVFLKLLGGSLKVKDFVEKIGKNDGYREKINQIRVYSGSQYKSVNEVAAGDICAVVGLNSARIGDLVGEEEYNTEGVETQPILTYAVKNKGACDNIMLYSYLKELEEEDPLLHVTWDKNIDEIHVQVMGEIQIEVLQNMIQERYHILVYFENGKIIYKETILKETVGIGHFEPLRHYAEVHLLLEPAERGSGLQFESRCSEDVLAKNWQNLVLTHLEEKVQLGALIGAEITDMKIILIAGKAHPKHTEGGDFRQATYRAVRQGLRQAESVILEPIYQFEIETPRECIGRVMADLQKMNGNFSVPEIVNDSAKIKGKCPVYTMKNYQKELTAYTQGKGKMSFVMSGYDVCHNPEVILAQMKYDADADIDNTADSVFCAHGAGFLVPWFQVPEYAHIKPDRDATTEEENMLQQRKSRLMNDEIAQEEIDAIFANNLRNAKPKRKNWLKSVSRSAEPKYVGKELTYQSQEEYLLVDGYNIIFAWDELNELAKNNLDSARDKLMDILSNYQGFKKCNLILVFDAYKVSGGQGSVFSYHNIHVVYTKEAETADQYIEKVTHELVRKYQITVATSDRLEQMIIFGAGAKRISAKEFLEEIRATEKEITMHIDKNEWKTKGNYLFEQLSQEEIEKIKGN